MRSEQLVRPGLTVLERTVSAARMDAERATHGALEPMLDGGLVPRLEALLLPDVELSKDGRAMTRLAWLAQEGKSGSRGMLGQIAKLAYLRGLGADGWDLGSEPEPPSVSGAVGAPLDQPGAATPPGAGPAIRRWSRSAPIRRRR